MTFLEIYNLVTYNTQELSGLPGYSEANVKSLINRTYYDFVRKTQCMELDIDITTVADQEYYTSSDAANLAFVYDVYEVRYIENGVSEYGDILRPVTHKSLSDKYQTGTPDCYWVKNNQSKGGFKIGTDPIVSNSGSTLRVSAYIFPTIDLVDDTDEPGIKEAYQEALIEGAIHRIYKVYAHKNRDYRQRSNDALAIYNTFLNVETTEQKDRYNRVTNVYPE